MATQTTVYRLAFWSAICASVFSIAYDIGQLAEWLGLMGSGGGPESDSTWQGLVVLLVPSLFLGISFVIMMVGLHSQAPDGKRVLSRTALAFANHVRDAHLHELLRPAHAGRRISTGGT